MDTEQREQYVAKYKARLDQWEAEIDALKGKAAEASADARIRFDQQVAPLRQKVQEHRHKLDELREASGNAWNDIKAGFERAWGETQATWTQVKERFH